MNDSSHTKGENFRLYKKWTITPSKSLRKKNCLDVISNKLCPLAMN